MLLSFCLFTVPSSSLVFAPHALPLGRSCENKSDGSAPPQVLVRFSMKQFDNRLILHLWLCELLFIQFQGKLFTGSQNQQSQPHDSTSGKTGASLWGSWLSQFYSLRYFSPDQISGTIMSCSAAAGRLTTPVRHSEQDRALNISFI